MVSWVIHSALSGLAFGLGDFFIAFSEKSLPDAVLLYVLYSLIIGSMVIAYLLYDKQYIAKVKKVSWKNWGIVFAVSIFYFFAHFYHFSSLRLASNPGYANALVMFHVVYLTALSWYFLNAPINWITLFGIALMFTGAYLIVTGGT